MLSTFLPGLAGLTNKATLADLDKLVIGDSQTNMWNNKQIGFAQLRALMGGNINSVNGYTGTVSLGLLDLDDIPDPVTPNYVLSWDGTNLVWVAQPETYDPGSGETNTASNVGDGVDIFKQKTGVDLEFRGIKAGPGITPGIVGDNIVLTFDTTSLTTPQVDALSALIGIVSSGGGGGGDAYNVSAITYNSLNQITAITINLEAYTLTYHDFGEIHTVTKGGDTWTTTYNETTGRLESITGPLPEGGGCNTSTWYQDSTGDGTIIGAINGSNVTFTLSNTPSSYASLVLSYNGQVLEYGASDDYTIAGNVVTMVWPPEAGKLTASYPTSVVGVQNAGTRITTDVNAANGEVFRSSDHANSLYYKDSTGDVIKLIDITSNKIPEDSIDLTTTGTGSLVRVSALPTIPAPVATDTKVIAFSRDQMTASATVQYTHSLGRVPVSIQITGVGAAVSSIGFYGGGVQKCVCTHSSGQYNVAPSYAAYMWTPAGGTYTYGIISNLTTTTFDITWTKYGSPSSNPYEFIALIS